MAANSIFPAVMFWRQVSSFASAEEFATQLNGWPRIGANRWALMYDAGSVIVGMWSRKAFLEPKFLACTDGLVAPEQALAPNPASEFVIRTRDFAGSVRRLEEQRGLRRIALNDAQRSVSFLDRDGNYASYVSATGVASQRIQLRSGADTSASGRLVAHRIMVSDLAASIEFYRDIVGLALVSQDAEQVVFDATTIELVLRREETVGLVESLIRSHRMEGDSLSFYAPDIDERHARMASKGVLFPKGVHTSAHGRVGAFADPDGHALGIWQPPARPDDIDYFKVLQRILGEATGADAV